MKEQHRMIVIVWAPHETRTEMFSRRLNAPIHHVHFLGYKKPMYAPFKYPLQWIKTWQILFRERPKYVYVTNPPIFAALCVYIYSLFSGIKMIMDTHSPALYSRKWGWSVPLQRWVAKGAMLNVVDQEEFSQLFESWGAKTVILERPPKQFQPEPKPHELSGRFRVALINTFAEDEPLQCVIDAARLQPDIDVEITGDLSHASREMLESAPPNCNFTGYLVGKDYVALLHRVDTVMALTTFTHSLLGGAQEGMTLGKAVIVSDQPALREFFYKGTLFVQHEAESIAKAFVEARERYAELSQDIADLREEHAEKWEQHFQQLEAVLHMNGRG